jgi:hypothetical protein
VEGDVDGLEGGKKDANEKRHDLAPRCALPRQRYSTPDINLNIMTLCVGVC